MNSPSDSTTRRLAKEKQRDVATLRILGLFFLTLGSLVLVATAWTLDSPRAAIVNLVSGGTIAGVGLLMRFVASRLSASP